MTVNENKTEALRVRVTKSERAILEQMCKKYRVSMSELIRTIIFYTEILDSRKSDVDYINLMKEVQILQQHFNDFNRINQGVANNINQIVRDTHIKNSFNSENRGKLVSLINSYSKSLSSLKKVVESTWQSLK